MVEQESRQTSPPALIERLRAIAPWLLAPELATCAVGSTALREACRRADLRQPQALDLDLAWALSPDAGEALLREHGVYVATTAPNRARGTLALNLEGERIEITSFRGVADGDARTRIDSDLRCRDMTVGAIAWWLAPDRIVDPCGGLEDWRSRRVMAVGEPAARVREHPIRWLRWYRKAHAWDFTLDPRIRKLDLDRAVLDDAPSEAVAAEIRMALELPSPGRLLLEWFEAGVLQHLAPELAAQFDGRPAGPVRYHPEVSQALHLLLALEWIAARSDHLDPADRHAVRFAVLCHDLGKNVTPSDAWPSHRGHEHAGLALIDSLCERLPGLADQRARNLARRVSELHLVVRGLRDLRPGTVARLYDEHFRDKSFPRHLFALAVAADVGGRLHREAEGEAVATSVERDIDIVCERCEGVDAAALRAAHPDVETFRGALHEARARQLKRLPD